MAAIGIALASCGSGVTVTRAEGTIAGTASVCAASHARHVTVDVLADASLRAFTTTPSGGHFEFHLSPGHYVVSTGHAYSRVTLEAGAKVTVTLVPHCVGNPT